MGGSSSTWIDATLTVCDREILVGKKEKCQSKYMGSSSHSLGGSSSCRRAGELRVMTCLSIFSRQCRDVRPSQTELCDSCDSRTSRSDQKAAREKRTLAPRFQAGPLRKIL
jgi:hypothetical protein